MKATLPSPGMRSQVQLFPIKTTSKTTVDFDHQDLLITPGWQEGNWDTKCLIGEKFTLRTTTKIRVTGSKIFHVNNIVQGVEDENPPVINQ